MFAEGARGIISPKEVAAAIVGAAPHPLQDGGFAALVIPRVRRLLGDRGWDAEMARRFPMSPREKPARTAELGVEGR